MKSITKKKREISPEAKAKKNLKKRLLDLWALIVKLKAGKQCEICGSGKCLNSHHIITKQNLTLKWDLRNGVCLCANCHTLSSLSAHGDPLFFTEWLLEHRPEDYQYLRVRKNERFDKDYARIEQELNNLAIIQGEGE